jgi:hypothetical protein
MKSIGEGVEDTHRRHNPTASRNFLRIQRKRSKLDCHSIWTIEASRSYFCWNGPKMIGVSDGDRTRDHWSHNPGLYQLSYAHHIPKTGRNNNMLLGGTPIFVWQPKSIGSKELIMRISSPIRFLKPNGLNRESAIFILWKTRAGFLNNIRASRYRTAAHP